MGSRGVDEGFTEKAYLCREPLKNPFIMLIVTHIAAALAFYLVLRNNPKVEKIVDKAFTYVENRLKALFSKISGNDQ